MQTSTKITHQADLLASQYVNPSGICINSEPMLAASIFALLSRPGSWAAFTALAFIQPYLLLHSGGSILDTAGRREAVPQLPVPSIRSFICLFLSL